MQKTEKIFFFIYICFLLFSLEFQKHLVLLHFIMPYWFICENSKKLNYSKLQFQNSIIKFFGIFANMSFLSPFFVVVKKFLVLLSPQHQQQQQRCDKSPICSNQEHVYMKFQKMKKNWNSKKLE